MKKIVIHIGDAKTGSSYLQKCFSINCENFKSNDWIYPETGRLKPNGIAQHLLAFNTHGNYPEWVSIDPDSNLDIFDKLLSEIDASGCQNVLISSEGFSSVRSLEDLYRLKNILSDFEVNIVAYVRDPEGWYDSYYAQCVKNFPFTCATYPEFISRNDNTISSVVENYASVFGGENVFVKSYLKAKKSNLGILKDFLCLIGIDDFYVFSEAVSENVTPGIDLIKVFRILNEELEIDGRVRKKIYSKIMSEVNSDTPYDSSSYGSDKFSEEHELLKSVIGDEKYSEVLGFD